jgi:hypothetical protein
LLTAALAAVLLLALFCTINDDNGNPVEPGMPPGGGGGTVVGGGSGPGDSTGGGGGKVTLVPAIIADNGYAGVGDTVQIIVTLLADTAKGAAVISGGNIKVSAARSGDWAAPSVLTTNTNGQAILKFSSGTEGTARIKLTYGSAAERNVDIEVTDDPPRNITISASPAVLPADGSSKSVITVQVKNNENNPIVGDVIKFSTNMGLITAEGTTDAEGKATAQLTSEQRNALATITATLKSDGARSVKIAVEFSGVTITTSVSPETIKPDTSETAEVEARLFDASKNPIVGEKITFIKKDAKTKFVSVDTMKMTVTDSSLTTTTNNRGVASCVIKSEAKSDGEWIFVRGAGAKDSVRVNYSGQIITVKRSGGDDYSGNKNTSTFTVKYTESNGRTAVNDAELKVTVTMGTMTGADGADSAKVIFAKVLTLAPGDNGEKEFTFNNPDFTGLATIYVKGVAKDGASATYTMQVLFKANGAARIKLEASPNVIVIGKGKATLTATAYDASGNRVSGEVISFNVIKGPGGGEYIQTPTATTSADGSATTDLVAGTIPSMFQDVKVVASNYNENGRAYITSDTVSLTIAGTPKHITVRRNIDNISAGTATYTLKLSALVSDINNNPVNDAEVTFSSEVVGYRYYMRRPRMEDGACKVDTVPVDVVSEDFYSKGSRPFKPFPSFNDINHNGFPDSRAEICSAKGDSIIEVKETVSSTDNSIYDIYKIESGRLVVNGVNIPAYDVDVNKNGIPDPNTAVIMARTVTTKNGIADNEIIYGQSDAGKIRIKVWAECQGLVTSSPDEFVLPIAEGAKNWNPFE